MGKYLTILVAVLLTGCASVSKGVNQSLSVSTAPALHAECKLVNKHGVWYVRTPGTAMVHRGYDNLEVHCSKPGYAVAHKSVPSKTTAHIAGNIIAGGVIGAGVDALNGSAYDYPDEIVVPLKKQHIAVNHATNHNVNKKKV